MPGVEEFNSDIKVLGTVTATYIVKENSSDNYILLGGGGHTLVSNFATYTSLSTNYYTKTESDSRFAIDSNTVHKNGDESVDGEKNYLKTLSVNNISKQGGATKVFHHVYAQSLGSAQPVGMLSIKIPLATAAQTAFNVSITIQGREGLYLGTLELSFFRSTATNIYQAKAVLRADAPFPTEVINMGHDAAGNICINIGEPATVWGRYLTFSVDKVQTSHTGWATNWANGWSHAFETSTAGYASFQPVSVERLLIFEKTKVINTTGAATNSKISTYNIPQNSWPNNIRIVENPIEAGPVNAIGAVVIKLPNNGNIRVKGHVRNNLGRVTSFDISNFNANVTSGAYLSNNLFINKVRYASKGNDRYLILNDIDNVWDYHWIIIESITYYSLLSSTPLQVWNKQDGFSIEFLTNLSAYTVGNPVNELTIPLTENSLSVSLSNYYTKSESVNLFVGRTGVETIADTKTFSSSPVVPSPTLDNHAVNRGWVTSQGYLTNASLTGYATEQYVNTTINGLNLSGTYAPLSHVHAITDVTGLQGALEGKVDDSQVLTDVPAGAVFTDTIYTHPTTPGNKHVPAGGAAGQILRWSADGTAVWGADNNTTYSNGTGLVLLNNQFSIHDDVMNDVALGKEANSWGNHSSAGYLTTESDPTVPTWVKSITQANIDEWQGKVNRHGDVMTGGLSINPGTTQATHEFKTDNAGGRNDIYIRSDNADVQFRASVQDDGIYTFGMGPTSVGGVGMGNGPGYDYFQLPASDSQLRIGFFATQLPAYMSAISGSGYFGGDVYSEGYSRSNNGFVHDQFDDPGAILVSDGSVAYAEVDIINDAGFLRIQPAEITSTGVAINCSTTYKHKLIYIRVRNGNKISLTDPQPGQRFILFNVDDYPSDVEINSIKAGTLEPYTKISCYITNVGEVIFYDRGDIFIGGGF